MSAEEAEAHYSKKVASAIAAHRQEVDGRKLPSPLRPLPQQRLEHKQQEQQPQGSMEVQDSRPGPPPARLDAAPSGGSCSHKRASPAPRSTPPKRYAGPCTAKAVSPTAQLAGRVVGGGARDRAGRWLSGHDAWAWAAAYGQVSCCRAKRVAVPDGVAASTVSEADNAANGERAPLPRLGGSAVASAGDGAKCPPMDVPATEPVPTAACSADGQHQGEEGIKQQRQQQQQQQQQGQAPASLQQMGQQTAGADEGPATALKPAVAPIPEAAAAAPAAPRWTACPDPLLARLSFVSRSLLHEDDLYF
jgi:hypothetical protein